MAYIDTIKGRVKGIIFDYGGTIDSRGDHWSEIIYEGYQAAGLSVERNTFRDAYVFAERELARVRHIEPQHNFADLLLIKMRIELNWLAERDIIAKADVEELAHKIADYCYNYARKCVEEARPVLQSLSEQYPMVLVSNFYGNVDSVLRDFDLRRYFNGVIESAVVGVRKPDARIFMLGVVALGLKPEEVMVVGDSLRKDILPAESIGCMSAWIKGRGWTADEDAATHPTQISGLQELLQLITEK
jgi:putative hydrolase of the HAD superfamily